MGGVILFAEHIGETVIQPDANGSNLGITVRRDALGEMGIVGAQAGRGKIAESLGGGFEPVDGRADGISSGVGDLSTGGFHWCFS